VPYRRNHRFLDDGRICLTSNAAERALHDITLGRKPWLFVGSYHGGECTAIYMLIGPPSSTTSTPKPGSPTCWAASPTIRLPASINFPP
jgi:hypothetical protein